MLHSNLRPVAEPKATPVNYNAIRKMELAELEQDKID